MSTVKRGDLRGRIWLQTNVAKLIVWIKLLNKCSSTNSKQTLKGKKIVVYGHSTWLAGLANRASVYSSSRAAWLSSKEPDHFLNIVSRS